MGTFSGGSTVPAFFRTTWATSVGQDSPHIFDGPGPGLTGARFDSEGWCGRDDILYTVTAASVGSSIRGNLLRSTYRGTNGCRYVQKLNAVPLTTSHWGRIYYRREENTWAGAEHNVAYNFQGSIQMVPFTPRALADGSGWTVRWNATNNTAYPHGVWIAQTGVGNTDASAMRFDLNRDYRYEWYLEYLNGGTQFRFYPRLYDDTNTLVADQNNFYRLDSANGASIYTTLPEWYASGGAFTVLDSALMRNFGIGNEGRLGAPNNGLSEYFGDVCLTTNGWPGNREAVDL